MYTLHSPRGPTVLQCENSQLTKQRGRNTVEEGNNSQFNGEHSTKQIDCLFMPPLEEY